MFKKIGDFIHKDKNKKDASSPGNLPGPRSIDQSSVHLQPDPLTNNIGNENSSPRISNPIQIQVPDAEAADGNKKTEGNGTEPKKSRMNQLQDYTKKKINGVQDAIKSQKEKLQIQSKDQLQKGKEKIVKSKEHFLELTGEIRKNIDTIKNDIKSSINNQVREFMKNQKEKLNYWLRLQIEKSVVKVLAKAPPKIKKSLKAPGMWSSVERVIDDLVDEVWPDVEEEILYQLRLKINKPYVNIPTKKEVPCLLKPWYWFRNWYLYTTNPVDMNFWQQSRTVSYWILVLARMIPWWGVQPFFFTLVFLMIDKNDEYQLVNFILQFKKYQFFTAGIINGVIGYVLYFICTSVGKFDSFQDFSDCTVNGPGVGSNVFVDITSFLLQIGLVWICFILLPFSEPKGRPKFKYVQIVQDKPEKETRCCCFFLNPKRGRRIKKFMIWDMITSIFAIGMFFVIYYALNSRELFQAKSTIYFCKLIYGMLSFPFLIFAVPMFQTLLTKSRPTAYDRDGNCLPLSKGIEKKVAEELVQDEEENDGLLAIQDGGNFEELLEEKSQQVDQLQV